MRPKSSVGNSNNKNKPLFATMPDISYPISAMRKKFPFSALLWNTVGLGDRTQKFSRCEAPKTLPHMI